MSQYRLEPIVRLSDRFIMGYELLAGETHCPQWDVQGWREFYRFLAREIPAILDRTPQSLFINASGSQLLDTEIMDCLTNLPCNGRLVLEWTEQWIPEDRLTEVLMILAEMRRRTWEIAIDDIGSGMDGMGRAMACKPQFAKIDHALLHHARGKDHRFLQGMVSALHSEDILMIVEGIETEKDLGNARLSGADYGQGWLFAER